MCSNHVCKILIFKAGYSLIHSLLAYVFADNKDLMVS